MVNLYRDPLGEKIFSHTMSSVAMSITNNVKTMSDRESELKERIKELEAQLKKRKVGLII